MRTGLFLVAVAASLLPHHADSQLVPRTWNDLLSPYPVLPAPVSLDRGLPVTFSRAATCGWFGIDLAADTVTLVASGDGARAAALYAVVGGGISPDSLVPVSPPVGPDTARFAVLDQRCSSLHKAPAWLLLERQGRQLLYASDGASYPYLRVREGNDLSVAEWDPTRKEFAARGTLAAREQREERQAVAELRRRGWSPGEIDAVRRGVIRIGMTEEMVIAAWGEPDNVNRTITRSGSHEQWVYEFGGYVYLENGRVTAIQSGY